ncbi:NAD(P)-binding protein [Nocardia speluncae]|uniref:NAD(P)-binding protein n=1 Tax=Nocardia speluncae TaxID=419477 RepID=A0A846XQI5_9NOCA|nr:FAD-dependent oxidoreductase [Nocardia speluncae]NKY36763.1 NAD(P)-binding protein [Nocardia speluncae]
MTGESSGQQRRAVVVGAGIAGLTAAVALRQRGWRVEVLERATEVGPAGSGLSLWPNGLRGLDTVGIGAAVREQALSATEAGMRDPSGRWLARTDVSGIRDRYGDLVMIHRTDLFDILRGELGDTPLRLGAVVDAVDITGDGVRIRHSLGTSEADLVFGADGINSTVRSLYWPDAAPPAYAGYTAWRSIVRPRTPVTSGGETIGRGERFGIAPLRDGRVYFYGSATMPAGTDSPGGELTEFRRRFAGWHDPIPDLLAATDPAALLRHDIYELPPLAGYIRGPIALLGDAAHAMTPNLGQGANLAIEDAVTVAALLDRYRDIPSALAEYDRVRRARVAPLQRLSRRMGSALQLSGTPAVLLRNMMMRMAPTGPALRGLAPVLTWEPPDSSTLGG